MIRTIIEPNVQKTFEDFIATAPPFSIALDGYVRGPPRFDLSGPWANLNHHEGVDRTTTGATCSQAYGYVKQGLFKRFSKGGIPTANLYFNDPDQDSSFTRWLLTHADRFTGQRSEPLLSRLLFAEDQLDRTGGTYPFPVDSEIMRDIAWVFEPYNAQISKIRSMNAQEMETIMDSIDHRINQYLLGKGKQVAPDARFETLYQGTFKGEPWVMIGSAGPYARSRIFSAGTYACIVYKGQRPNGAHDFAISRMSRLIDYPVKGLFYHFNELEGIPQDASDRWDGGDDIGGSPLMSGSKMPPAQLAAAAQDYLNRQAA